MKDNCKNCGADQGLHHCRTMQCPVSGREAPVGRKQEWMDTVYEADGNQIASLTARVAELKAALKDAIEALEGAQGEWQSVSVVYLPEHLIDLRMAEIGARTALLEAK